MYLHKQPNNQTSRENETNANDPGAGKAHKQSVNISPIKVIIFLTSSNFFTFATVIANNICRWGNIIDDMEMVSRDGILFPAGFTPEPGEKQSAICATRSASSNTGTIYTKQNQRNKKIMELRINTESPAARAIIAMAHTAGTAEIYINTLSRLSNAVLFNQDDMGMDDTETLDTIRALSLLRSDIRDIATDKTIADSLERAGNLRDDIGNLIDPTADVTGWDDPFAANPEFTEKAEAAARIRTYSHAAGVKAAHTFEILEKILTDMVREGYPAEKITEISEAIELQKKAAEILKRNLADLTASEAKNEEGGDQPRSSRE